MDFEEVVRLLRVGACSEKRRADQDCATCDRCDEAIAWVRELNARDERNVYGRVMDMLELALKAAGAGRL